ncbi:MAG: hypothetical protein PWP64_479 [Candidatus Cloacimonadota bacterium]|nr:hypothetical protein [Candidatus Cloacimonadota bacterium]
MSAMEQQTCSCSCGSDCSADGCVTNTAASSVYACAGASNVGIISLELAKALHNENRYTLGCSSCVAVGDCGCGSDNEGPKDLLIDGCKVGCVKKIFDKQGKTHYNHVVVTQLGVKKEPNFDFSEAQINALLKKLSDQEL